MKIKEQIDEIFAFLREDLSHVCITGTIWQGDIDPNKYEREEVEEQSFDHFYQYYQNTCIEDCGMGEILIPIGEDVYLTCEFNT